MNIYGQRSQVPGAIIIDGKDSFIELNSVALNLIVFSPWLYAIADYS